MFHSIEIGTLISGVGTLLAQTPLDPTDVTTPEEAALVFSGPKFFVALISGVVLAIATQLVLTNLSIAAGISYLGHSGDDSDHSSSQSDSGSFGGTVKKIGTAVGLWTLVTVSLALFVACLLAVKLSLIESSALGAIVGLVIWAAYFSLLFWFSSNTVTSMVGSIINTATSGVQSLIGTATAAMGAKAASNQVVSTAEAAAAAVRRELTAGIDPGSIRDSVEDYLERLKLPEFDLSRIRRDFETLVNDPELRSLASSGELSNIDRQQFVDLVSSRTDFSRRDVERIANTLYSVWYQVLGQQQDPISTFRSYLSSAKPDQLRSREFNSKLDQLIDEVRRSRKTTESTEKKQPGLMEQALQYGLSTLTGAVLSRADLSNLDVEKILTQLQSTRDRLSDQAGQVGDKLKSAMPYSTIRADVENYLLNSYSWHLNRETINQEFPQILHDPQADPGVVRRDLERLDRTYFVDLLSQRGVFAQERINEIADQLENIRVEVLGRVQSAEHVEGQQDLRTRVETYLRSTGKDELNPEGIEREFGLLLSDPHAGYEALRTRLSHFDRETLVALIKQRTDLSPEESAQLLTRLETTRDRVLSEAQNLSPQHVAEKTKERYDATLAKIADYLRNTGREELNPEGIQRDLQTLLHNPQEGAIAVRQRLSQLDRETLVKLLSQRQDLSEEQVNHLIDQVQEAISTIVRMPRRFASRTQQRVQDFQGNLETYLRNTHKEELNPEGIKRDLQTLLSDPRGGISSLSDRLSLVDRSTVVALLSQRKDMTEEEANRVVDQVISVRDQTMEQVRGIQRRIQSTIDSIFARIRNYLNSLERPELNYEGIRHDFRTLFNDPKAGFEALRDRLGSFNRETLVAILSSREDVSEADVNRLIDQAESARTNVLRRAERVQEETQRRLAEVRYQAKKQAEEARKAAASAAWWVFGTAVVSAAASALAGAVAVAG
ncbi:MAG: MFS transporter [Leptolyngbyaceae cyanobacterium bins.59]|nr:MFS transporter [Leptolyngbyaceae cyanobacterium bins.59]